MEYTCVANSRAYFNATSLNARYTHFAMAPCEWYNDKAIEHPYLMLVKKKAGTIILYASP
ncbi:hypothetical protein [Bartonella sp. CM120XJJH]|uniref:hypothetical protein n=1 Tax=Bartonella sp. CM120XJJH TaxID=3243544 RepID=UPI0035CF608F